MHRAITGFHTDPDGDWVAELACGHGQHVRHRPPFQERPWVERPEGRAGRIGSVLDCPWCDLAEPPDGLYLVRTSAVWDQATMPAGLRRSHRLAAGVWGRIAVRSGRLRFHADTEPALDLIIDEDRVQYIPPEVTHSVEPVDAVAFTIDFMRVPGAIHTGSPSAGHDEGGQPACLAHEICPECAAVVAEDGHRPGCSRATLPGPS